MAKNTPFGTKGGAKQTRAERKTQSIGGMYSGLRKSHPPQSPFAGEGGRNNLE